MGTIRGRLASAVVLCCVFAAYLVVSAPLASADDKSLKPHDNIVIKSDDQFDAAHGVVAGSGTPEDPFVISGWKVHHIHIADTSAALVIEDNEIPGQLILNWNGPNVRVVRNTVGDLRVNQNVKRTGAATSGLIAWNEFDTVGQLRHFDGVFERNVVKPPQDLLFDPIFGAREAVQFDGFNGAIFRNNTLYGPLDVKLHGHHHGSSFGETSHHHSSGAHAMDAAGTDHTKRYHEVFVENNTIHAPGLYALRWTDTAHRGDDRTATSEQNEELNKPHQHWTRVHLTGNRLIGSGLYVDVFNADDENHLTTGHGFVEVADNIITLDRADTEAFDPRYGIQVWNAKDLDLRITNNKIVSQIEENAATELWQRTVGIFLEDMTLADAYVTRNEVTNTYYGVRASYLAETVDWWVTRLATEGVVEDVYYDQSVSNPPRREP
jgi:hypothetical protein